MLEMTQTRYGPRPTVSISLANKSLANKSQTRDDMEQETTQGSAEGHPIPAEDKSRSHE